MTNAGFSDVERVWQIDPPRHEATAISGVQRIPVVQVRRQLTTALLLATGIVFVAAFCNAGEGPVQPTPQPLLPAPKSDLNDVPAKAIDTSVSHPAEEPAGEVVETLPTKTAVRAGIPDANIASDKSEKGIEEPSSFARVQSAANALGQKIWSVWAGAAPAEQPHATIAAAPVAAQPADDKKPDAPAPAPAPKIDAATDIPKPQFSGPACSSCRDKLDDEELEMVYQPSSVEGYAGWKRNKVPPKQLIDNDILGVSDRWRVGLDGDSRHVKGNFWNPYRQNMLKGDYPIIGQSIFLETTFADDTFIEGHGNPTPSGVTAQGPGRFEFFGGANQFLIQQNFIISLELFKGETSFKPPEWTVRITPVFNLNYLETEENFAVNIDPRQGRTRLDSHESFQEFFGEYHFKDLSPNYDFIAARLGTQFFNEDFRGFLFADNNFGARAFGILESNRLQYNLAAFDMLNKDTNSGLNTFDFKGQQVLLANLIRTDTFFKGHNMIFNLAYSKEEPSVHYDENGVIVRPAPIGDLRSHENKVAYIGIGDDGHIGRVNITSQFYQALGEDTHNNIAGRPQTINAQMAATELSYDMDWMRFRASAFYASGDGNPNDGKATGFDSIFDDPNFAGGQFSWWVSQGGFGAGNTLTQLKSRDSLLPSLNTSKGEGQRNFVNPGLRLLNVGYDANLTQKLKAILNVNYLQFDNTASLEQLLHMPHINRDIGFDTSVGMQYRPWLNNQVVISSGVSGLTAAQGFQDIYAKKDFYYAGFLNLKVRY